MISLLFHGSAVGGPLPVDIAADDHPSAAPDVGARVPGDVMDSLGTTEAVVTVSERVTPRAAAGFAELAERVIELRGVPRERPARCGVVSGFPSRDPVCLLTVTTARSDVPPRDDFLANRHDAIYRDNPESRAREVVA